MNLDYYLIGERIRKRRKEKNLTQEALAEAVNVGTTHISHIETGNSIPSLKVFSDIIRILETSSDDILGGNLGIGDTIKNLDEQIAADLSDCSAKELEFLAELLHTAKIALRKHKIL